MKKKIIYSILLLFLFLSFSLKVFAASDFTYELDDSNFATITSYSGSNAIITIPNKIDNYEVKSISDHAFNENQTSTNGKILKNVIISEGITTVGDFAFVDCTNLESVTLPESLTNLGFQTFIGCSKLNSINITSNISSLQNCIFQETGFSEFVIPENIKQISSCAFRICKNLKSVKIYSSDVKFEDDDVFQNCSADLVLYGYSGSTTETYANNNNLAFKLFTDESDTIPISSIQLNKSSLTLNIGDSENITATVLPTDATNKTLSWSSNNNAVATVSQTGKITAMKAGKATISVQSFDNVIKSSCEVNVVEKIVTPRNVINNIINDTKLPQTGFNYTILNLLFLLIIITIIFYVCYKHFKEI